jgi:UDP-N-acetylglucosamine 2-epimerase (non-hydrolysing)
MNRQLTGRLADLHFAPTLTARYNLLAEGVREEQIWVTGNTVIDALLQTIKPDYELPGDWSVVDWSKRIVLVTAHRRENWGDPMRSIFLAVKDVLEAYSDVEVIFPVHKNPVVRELAAAELGMVPRVHLVEPLDYEPFAHLMNKSHLILTDSGGIQEEAPSLGKPVLVLRNTTERPEALEAGTVRLVGTDRSAIAEATIHLLGDNSHYEAMAQAVNPYGDGQASGRIAEVVREFLSL